MAYGEGKLTTIHDRVNFYKDVYNDPGVHFEREGNKISLVTGKGIVFNDKLIIHSEDALNHAFDTYKPLQNRLNKNQQVVLELLQKAYAKNKWMTPFGAVFSVANENDFAIRAWLTKEEQFKVLAVFMEWGMKEVTE